MLGSTNTKGYVTADVEQTLQQVLLNGKLIDVLRFFGGSGDDDDKGCITYTQFISIFCSRSVDLSSSVAHHLFHRYKSKQLFDVNKFVDDIITKTNHDRLVDPRGGDGGGDRDRDGDRGSNTSSRSSKLIQRHQHYQQHLLQGRLASCRNEIRRLNDKIDVLKNRQQEKKTKKKKKKITKMTKHRQDDDEYNGGSGGSDGQTTPRLMLPKCIKGEENVLDDEDEDFGDDMIHCIKYDDEEKEKYDDDYIIAGRSRSSRKKGKRRKRNRNKHKKTSKYSTSAGALSPTDEIEYVLNQNSHLMLVNDSELEMLRKDIVQIILGSKLYGSSNALQIQNDILQRLSRSTLSSSAAHDLISHLEQQLPTILPFV